ncbi:branched-chain amino acid aminotransferase [Xylaria arbuscula]|nr:branched-chain amino acid aminotransferase [Xylaria arbuscula]
MFPPPPESSVAWDTLRFDVYEVNGHVESHYSKSNGQWSEPEFVVDPLLRIHGMTPALMYGQQAFEGLKAYRTPSGEVQIFRPSMNAQRMMRSTAYVSIPPVPEETFLSCVNMAVAKNASFAPPHGVDAALYIRPFIFGTTASLSMASPDKYCFCVYVTPVKVAYGLKSVRALILEDYDRVAPEGTGPAKVGGNYSPLVRHIEAASASEYGILLHVDSKTRTEIDEFSMAGFIGIRADPEKAGSYILAVPLGLRTIESVTSDSVCRIAQDLGWKTERRAVKCDELPEFEEVLAAGTASGLVPVRSISRRSTGEVVTYNGDSEEPGPCCAKLLSILKSIQQGDVEDRFGWCHRVTSVG